MKGDFFIIKLNILNKEIQSINQFTYPLYSLSLISQEQLFKYSQLKQEIQLFNREIDKN